MPDTVTGTAEAQPADESIRSALTAALTASEAPAEPAQTAAAPEAEAEVPVEEPEERPSGERARGPDGKFVKADEKPEAQAKPETKPEPEQKPAETKPNEPPANWSAADKEAFRKAPADIQAWALRRDKEMTADYTKKTQEIADFRREWEPVNNLFAPYREVMKQKGFTSDGLIAAWMNVEKALLDGKGVDIIKGLVSGYKIDPAQVVAALGVSGASAPAAHAAATAEPGAAPPNPAGQATALPPELAAQINALQQKIDGFERSQQTERQAALTRQQAEVNARIEQFKSATDDKGELAHPYFAEVEADMTRLVLAAQASGQQPPSLQELYDTAVWANPATRTKLQEAQRAADEAQRQAQQQKEREAARAKAAAAKKAGSSVTGAPGGGAPPQSRSPARSLRDEIAANLAEVESSRL